MRLGISPKLFLSISILVLSSNHLSGATYNIADGDVAGLIAAINASNASPGPDVIELAPNGIYTLTYIAGPDSWHGETGLPIVQGVSETQRETLTINGNGSTIQRSASPGTPDFRIFHALYANVILDSVIIKGGYGQGSRCGGGGLYLNVTNTLVRNSTITENFGFEGGGICNNNASALTIENSTISHNTGPGGEINNHVATLAISNSTVFDDHPHTGRGDSIVNAFSPPGSIVIKNSVIASPTGGDGIDCLGFTPISLGHNIFSDNTCGQNVGEGDLVISNLALGTLSGNGGRTPTHALLAGSPAIDAIPADACTTTSGQPVVADQRGAIRPIGRGCDIGAFESGDLQVGLISYWPADGNTNDVIGGNHGNFQNGAAYTGGTSGDSFNLNGTNYIEVPDSPSISLTGPLTISANIKLNNNTAQQAIVEKYDFHAFSGFLLRVESGNLVATICPDSPTICSQPTARGATVVTAGQWHHVAAVYDGSTIAVYLDGVLDGVVNTSLAPTDGSSSLKIGARGDDANTRLNGLVDEVRLYNRALPGQEILALADIDTTSPAISPSVIGTLGNSGWYTSDVEVSWSVTDPESAISSSTGCDSETITAETAVTTFTCSATSSGGTGSQSVTVKRDSTSPSISIAAPSSINYLLNQAASVEFACSDTLSGVESCVGTSPNAGPLDTASVGNKALTVNALDQAGNASSSTVNYTVGYAIQVLFDQTKAHKSGSTVPVKIRLVDANGANVSSPSTIVHAVSVVQISSQASTTLDDSGNSNPDFDFRYDAALGGYVFNLKTTGYGTGSYLLNFIVNGNPQTYSVGFQVRQ